MTDRAATACEGFVLKVGTLGDITSRKMFGGYGIFESGTMFALVDSEGQVFLKATSTNLKRFEAAGAERHGWMPHYQIPAAVMEDSEQLLEWSREAIELSKAD